MNVLYLLVMFMIVAPIVYTIVMWVSVFLIPCRDCGVTREYHYLARKSKGHPHRTI